MNLEEFYTLLLKIGDTERAFNENDIDYRKKAKEKYA